MYTPKARVNQEYGRYKVYLESESDLTLTNYFQFQYTFMPAMDQNMA